MNRRLSARSIITVLLLGIVLVAPQGADAAGFTQISGEIRQGVWRYYGTERTVTGSPWEIAFMKGDGPAIGMKYYGCGASAGAGEGPEVYVPDADPPYEWRWLREGKSWGITFCLAAKSYGNYSVDTFAGDLSWD